MTAVTLFPNTTGAKTYTLTYDEHGNLISKTNNVDPTDLTLYTWDGRNRLVSISAVDPVGTSTASFNYDATGRRIQRSIVYRSNAQRTYYVYDGMQAIGELLDGQLAATILTGLNIDEVIARAVSLSDAADGVTMKSYITDALGSVLAMTRIDQSPEVFYAYSAYGEVQLLGVDGQAPTNANQYTGRENDGVLGGTNGANLFYYRARYYDPTINRFIAEDPLGVTPTEPNLYSYAINQPTKYVDPEGTIALPLLTGGMGMIGGFYGALAAQLAFNGGNWKCVDWQDVFLSGVIGFAAGAALPFVGGSVFGVMGLGSVANTLQTLTSNYLRNGDPMPPGGDGYQMMQAMIAGAVGGVVGGVFRPVPALNRALPALLQPNYYHRALSSQAGVQQFTTQTAGGAVTGARSALSAAQDCVCKR
jgi:RHS repeat-associated protein